MLSWILQITIISIVLIFLVHYLFNFFKSTLTVPKIKDLVNSPTQKYESMFNIISKNNSKTPNNTFNKGNNDYNDNNDYNNDNNDNNNENEYTLTDLLPTQQTKTDMKNELKNFLKKQMNPTTDVKSSNNINNTTSISALDSMMSNSYSNF
jgi:CRISPR/Cas system CSM-associated protein Csm3 (group 7 of RAMP superfamily)